MSGNSAELATFGVGELREVLVPLLLLLRLVLLRLVRLLLMLACGVPAGLVTLGIFTLCG